MRWEHLAVPATEIARHNLAGHLNKLGDEGWELVSVASFWNPAAVQQQTVYYFKRPKA